MGIKKASTGCHIGINGVSGGCDQVVGSELVTKGVRKSNPEASGRVSRASGGFPESGEAPQADREYFSGKPRENEESFILHYPVWFGVARTMKER